MKTTNAMQLKALVKNKARESGVSAQLVLQNYMLERLLERISLSEHRDQIIIKGGVLIASLIGVDKRTTMDLDTTIRGFALSHESARAVFKQVCAVDVDDDIEFELVRIEDIREQDDYPGLRVSLKANYPPLSVPLTIDVTTGDKITPEAIRHSYSLLFEDRSIQVMSYNLETVLAEKLETILSRGAANTRPRDFYDVHMLIKLQGNRCDCLVLHDALEHTADKRGSLYVMADYRSIMDSIRTDATMRAQWDKYTRKFGYADGILFDEVCDTVLEVMSRL